MVRTMVADWYSIVKEPDQRVEKDEVEIGEDHEE